MPLFNFPTFSRRPTHQVDVGSRLLHGADKLLAVDGLHRFYRHGGNVAAAAAALRNAVVDERALVSTSTGKSPHFAVLARCLRDDGEAREGKGRRRRARESCEAGDGEGRSRAGGGGGECCRGGSGPEHRVGEKREGKNEKKVIWFLSQLGKSFFFFFFSLFSVSLVSTPRRRRCWALLTSSLTEKEIHSVLFSHVRHPSSSKRAESLASAPYELVFLTIGNRIDKI